MQNFAVDVTLVEKDAALDYGTFNVGSSNEISDSNKLGLLSNGANPFILGASPLSADGDVFWNKNVKYDGFISKILGDENGYFKSGNEFLIRAADVNQGKLITSVIMFFDKTAQQWAELLEIDGNIYKNNKYYAAFLLDPKTEHTLKIIKWNKPFYPIRITAVVTGYAESYDNARIRSIKWTKALYDDNAKPHIGLTSAYGEIELADRDAIVENLAALSVIDRMSNCSIKQNPDAAITGEDTGGFSYLTDRYKMNFGDNFFKVSLTDAVEKLRGAHYEGFPLTNGDVNAGNVFTALSDCAKKYGINLIGDTVYYKSIKLKYAYIQSGTLYDAVKEFCILIGGTAYTDNQNQVIIKKLINKKYKVDENGLISPSKTDKVVRIFSDDILDDIESELTLDNRIGRVKYVYKSAERKKDTIAEYNVSDNTSATDIVLENYVFNIDKPWYTDYDFETGDIRIEKTYLNENDEEVKIENVPSKPAVSNNEWSVNGDTVVINQKTADKLKLNINLKAQESDGTIYDNIKLKISGYVLDVKDINMSAGGGESDNVFEMPCNLLKSGAKYDNKNLCDSDANDLIVNNKYGKQTIRLSVPVCPAEIDGGGAKFNANALDTGMIVQVFKCRRAEYVKDSAEARTVALDRYGKVKNFIITKIESVYDGEYIKNLELKEVYNG